MLPLTILSVSTNQDVDSTLTNPSRDPAYEIFCTVVQLVGIFLFIYGSVHQNRCHRILSGLREGKTGTPPNVDRYSIPCGGWFDSLSCPHYTAEIILYVGLSMVSSPICLDTKQWIMWLVVLAVLSNLAVGAEMNHRWYLNRFMKYPTGRFALIPNIF